MKSISGKIKQLKYRHMVMLSRCRIPLMHRENRAENNALISGHEVWRCGKGAPVMVWRHR
jgi:hypothetical protein